MMFRLLQCRRNGISCLFSMNFSTDAAAAAVPHNNLLVEMLVNSLGFSTDKAISTSAKVTHLKPGNNKPKLVIDFFQQIGLDKTQIKTLVSYAPSLLFAKVDKTLKPKIKLLEEELGLSGTDLAKLLSKSRGFFLFSSLDNTIRPSLDYFRKLLGSHDSVIKLITKNPHILFYNAPKLMSPNIAFLQNLGVSGEHIQKLILRRPMLLLRINTEWLDKAVHRVQNDLHIPPHSTMFIYGLQVISTLGESSLEIRQETFRRFGWSDLDIRMLAQKNPLCFGLSEAKIGNALNFFMKELGYGAGYVASQPAFLTCSLEKRVLPRLEIMKLLNQKKLAKRSVNLYTLLNMTESKFLKNYVLPFKEEMPELYDLYMKSRR